jgi:cytoskeletal protein CcmA (bactofilin family)
MRKTFAACTMVLAFLFHVPVVQADTFSCDGAPGNIKIDDDVLVPDGATCILEGTRVKGNVNVEAGGALRTRNARIGGNIQADEAAWIVVGNGTRVKGDVQIEGTTDTPSAGEPNVVCGARIKGNLQVTKNTAPFDLGCSNGNRVKGNLQVQDNDIPGDFTGEVIAVSNNSVKGDLQFDDNLAAAAEATFDISDNRVKQNLQCSNNDPAPTGGGNAVKGDRDGQCSGL